MILTEKLEYLDNAVDWYIGTDIAEEFADSIFRVIWEDGGSKVLWNSVCVPIYRSHSPEDWKLVLLFSYLSTFSCFLTFIYSLLLRISPPLFSCLSSCVLIPLLEFRSADCCRTCRPNPVVSDRDKEPEAGVRCPLPICCSRVQDKRVHVVCRRLLMPMSHYLNNGRKRTLEVW